MLTGHVDFPTNRWTLTLLGCLCLGLLFHASAQDRTRKADTVKTHTTWRNYGGSPDGSQYSALRQINRSNVKELQVAWTYRTGDGRKYVFNPIVVDRTMYVLARNNSRGSGCRHGQGDLDAPDGCEHNPHHQSRNRLLGER
jgi:hypothetical protein